MFVRFIVCMNVCFKLSAFFEVCLVLLLSGYIQLRPFLLMLKKLKCIDHLKHDDSIVSDLRIYLHFDIIFWLNLS